MLLSCVWHFKTPWTVARQAPVHGILQARTLAWVPIPFSRGSSRPRSQTQISCNAGRFFFFFFLTVWALSKVLPIKMCVAWVIWGLCPLSSLQNITLLLIPGSQLGELAAHPQTTKGLFSSFLLQWTWFPFRKPPVIKNIWKHKKAVYSPWGGKDGGGLLFLPELPRFYCYFSQSQKLDFLVLSHKSNAKQIKS